MPKVSVKCIRCGSAQTYVRRKLKQRVCRKCGCVFHLQYPLEIEDVQAEEDDLDIDGILGD